MLEVLIDVFTGIEGWILAFAASAWVYPVLFTLTVIDGFFPPIPSESAVIALAVAAVAPGGPNLLLVLLVAAAGAWCGDQIAYQIGAMIGTDRVRFLQTERGHRMVTRARHTLLDRGAAFILAARYIPVGRVAVNMTAGALRYPRNRFMAVTSVAALMWAIYQSAIGIVAARWLANSVIWASVIGIVLGLAFGFLIDRVMTARAARKADREVTRGEAHDAARAEDREETREAINEDALATTCEGEPAGSNDQPPC